jgi:hypothetical protein
MAAEWFYTTNRQQKGPVSWRELRDLADAGVLKPGDLIWCQGMPAWIKAGEQADLFRATRPRDLDDDSEKRPTRQQPVRTPDRPRSDQRGVIVLVAGAAAGLIFLVLSCGALLWVAFALRGEAQVQSYTIHNLKPGDTNERKFEFKKGKHVIIDVITEPDTDVDLIVVRGPARHDIVAFDDDPDKDCHVDFVAHETGEYLLLIQNLGPDVARTCKVTITER